MGLVPEYGGSCEAAGASQESEHGGSCDAAGTQAGVWTRSLLLQLAILSIILFVQLVQRLLEMIMNQLREICVVNRGPLLADLT